MIQTLCSTVVYPQGFKILCSSSSVGPALAGYVTTYVASSGYVPTFESQYQNQMSGLQQQHSLFSQVSWGRLEMKPERNKFKVQAH